MTAILCIIAIVFTFSFAIFIHELGHFMFAKLFGVYVETFSIGFGKKLLKRTWGETEYAISAIPFGGYVKLRGMHSKEMEAIIAEEGAKKGSAPTADAKIATGSIGQPPLPESDNPRDIVEAETPLSMSESVVEEMNALRNKAWWQKVLLFAAGCINNFLTAVAVFFVMTWIGYHEADLGKPKVEKVEYTTSEAIGGLQPGDTITKIASEIPENCYVFIDKFEKLAKKGVETVPVEVQRDGQPVQLNLPIWAGGTPLKKGEKIVAVNGQKVSSFEDSSRIVARNIDTTSNVVVTKVFDGQSRDETVPILSAIGYHWPEIALAWVLPPYIEVVLPNLPAERAQFRSGDTIVSVNANPVKSAAQATRLIRASLGKPSTIEVDRNVNETTQRIALQILVREDPEHPGRGQIGVIFGGPPTILHKKPMADAFTEAFFRGYRTVTGYVEGLGDILFHSTFTTVRENVGGPIAIMAQIYQAAQRGVVAFFQLFAIFNILLAVTNLLPLPVFDGGHILFASIEAIIRRPLPAKILLQIYNVFIFLIIGLFAVITFNDVIMNIWRLK